MKNFIIFFLTVTNFNILMMSSAFSRCAVCVAKGMSGASIAIIVIISFFIFLALANWGLKKFLEKN